MDENQKPGVLVMRKMQAAAQCRARCEGWTFIAKSLRYRNAAAAQHALATKHPTLWTEELVQAIEEYIRDEVEPLAVQVQVGMMAFENALDPTGAAKVRQAAAHSLLAHAAKMRAQRVDINIKKAPEKADEELMRVLTEAASTAAREIAARRIAPEAVPVALIEEAKTAPVGKAADAATDGRPAVQAPESS